MPVTTEGVPVVVSGAFAAPVPPIVALSHTLVAATVPFEAVPDTVVATLNNVRPGERFDIAPNVGRYVMSEDNTKVLVGRRTPSAGTRSIRLTGYSPDGTTRKYSFDVTTAEALGTLPRIFSKQFSKEFA